MLLMAVYKLFMVVVVGLRLLPYRLSCLQKRDRADVLVSDHVSEMLALSSVRHIFTKSVSVPMCYSMHWFWNLSCSISIDNRTCRMY